MRRLISALEERLDTPTAKGLAQAVSRAIRDGELGAGDQLPPIRRLAEELMISPTTVSSAWQLLARSGTIRSDGRRGTTVAPTQRGGERYSRALRHESEVTLDLSTGVPDAALLPELAPVLAGLPGRSTPSTSSAARCSGPATPSSSRAPASRPCSTSSRTAGSTSSACP